MTASSRPGGHLVAAAGAAVLAAVLAHEGVPTPLRLPFGVLAVLVLPGYALAAAAFPDPRELGAIERLGLAIGLSLPTNALVALALDRSPWGLSASSVVAALTINTLTATAVAWWRGTRQARAAARPRGLPARWRELDRTTQLVVAGLLGTAAVVASALAAALLVPPPPLTEFYLLGVDGLTEGYPQAARTGEPVSVTVGIANHERRRAVYYVVLRDGDAVLGTLGPTALAQGDSVELAYAFAVQPPGRPSGQPSDRTRKVTFSLLKDGHAAPYREVYLWIDVAS